MEDLTRRWALQRNLHLETPAALPLTPGEGQIPMAVFDQRDDGVRTYRYALTRRWASSGTIAKFVMLNPSKADALSNDPTIRRCDTLAKRFGHSGLFVANLFALKATVPTELYSHPDPVGPHGDDALDLLAEIDGPVIVAWGTKHRSLHGRAEAVLDRLTRQAAPLWCLGTNKNGTPKHPLYLKEGVPLLPYQQPEAAAPGSARPS
jgi:hypothetical protein